MTITERHLLRTLHFAIERVPDWCTKQDTLFINQATQSVLNHLLDAEEPINKSEVYYEQAKAIVNHVDLFLAHRHEEDWSEETTFSYTFYGKVENANNRLEA